MIILLGVLTTPGKLAVQDQERQTTEMITMQVRDEYSGNLARVEPGRPERTHRGCPAVEQNGRSALLAQEDARLIATAAAEGITRSGERHRHG